MNHQRSLQEIVRLAAMLLVCCAATPIAPGRDPISQGPGSLRQQSVSNAAGRALLAKVIQALGGKEKVQAVRSVRVKLTERHKGPEGPEYEMEVESIVFLSPGGVWQRLGGLGPQPITQVVSPKEAFVTSFSEVHYADGRPATIEEITDEMPPAQKVNTLSALGRDPIYVAQHADEPSFVFRAAGSAKVGSVDTEILDVSHPATDVGYPAADVRWFVDSAGRIIRATWEQSPAAPLAAEEELLRAGICRKTTEDYSDWKLAEGVLFPFKETDTCEGDGKTSTDSLECKLFEVNPKVDARILRWPASVEAPAASNDQGKALLGQVIQALGGEEKVQSVKSIRVKGESRVRSLSRNEHKSNSETLIVFPDWIWVKQAGHGPGEEMTLASSPQGEFVTMGNAQRKITQEIPAGAMEAAVSELGRDPASDDFVYVAQHANDPNFIFYGAGTARIDGIDTKILDVSTPRTDVRWFVDPQSGRIVRASRRGKKSGSSAITGVAVSDYGDWKSVDGSWFPFLERTAASPGYAEFIEFTVSEIEVNPRVDLKIFEKPTYPVVQVPELKELAKARTIRLEDDWGGLGPSRRVHYELHPGADQFTGEATFSVSGLTKTESVQIPLSAAKSFFQILGEAPLEDREYVPRISHTDDYPSLQIELDLGNETVTFFTQSQGERHVPWAVKINQKTYVIDSDAPARALAVLDSYLKRDVLKKLLEQRAPSTRQ